VGHPSEDSPLNTRRSKAKHPLFCSSSHRVALYNQYSNVTSHIILIAPKEAMKFIVALITAFAATALAAPYARCELGGKVINCDDMAAGTLLFQTDTIANLAATEIQEREHG